MRIPVLRARRSLAGIACVALFAACDARGPQPPPAGPAAPRRIVVGVSLLTKTHAFYQDMEASMRATAVRLGIDLRVQSAEFSSAEQTSQVENFAAQKVDAIVVCPDDPKAIVGAVRRARDAGVPVFAADSRTDAEGIVAQVYSDNVQGGRLIGERLATALAGRGDVAIIDYPISVTVQDRVRGFETALAAHPEMKIVAKIPGGAVRDQSAQAMENLLQAHPGLKAVFGINDDSALGAISALAARGRKDVIVVGFDGTPEAKDAIRKGALLADAAQNPAKIGQVTLETVVAHLQGRPVQKEILIETSVIDKERLAGEGN